MFLHSYDAREHGDQSYNITLKLKTLVADVLERDDQS